MSYSRQERIANAKRIEAESPATKCCVCGRSATRRVNRDGYCRDHVVVASRRLAIEIGQTRRVGKNVTLTTFVPDEPVQRHYTRKASNC